MKVNIFCAVYALLIVSMLSSCNKEKKEILKEQGQLPPVTLADMLTCHNLTTWDSTAIRTKLIGKWDWEFIKCYWNPEDANGDDYKGLSIELKSDNTIEVKINGVTTQTSVWQMQKLNDGNYAITSNPYVVYIPGRIYFCEERVLFADTYTDGCDNYFKKNN